MVQLKKTKQKKLRLLSHNGTVAVIKHATWSDIMKWHVDDDSNMIILRPSAFYAFDTLIYLVKCAKAFFAIWIINSTQKAGDRSSRYGLYFRASCWPASFGLFTSESRLCSFHSCSSTMQCPARLSVTRQGARFLKRPQICLPEALKLQGCFQFFALQLNVNFPNCTFYCSLYCFYYILL